MDGRIDNNARDLLLDALEKAKAYSQKLEERREQRLWRKISFPCTLSDAIHGLTREQMDRIRKNLELKNLSTLKKGELASELIKWIPEKFKQLVYALDQGCYSLLKIAAANDGIITNKGMAVSQIEPLMGYSFIFPGIYNNQKALYMPQELVDLFSQTDGPELETRVRRNTEWVMLTHGMLYYYGVADPWSVKEKIKKLTGQEIDLLEFMKVISFASDFYGQIELSSYGYRDHRIFDAQKIVDEHIKRPSVAYYPFSKRQLLKAGEPNYIDKTPSMNSFINFLMQHYELSQEDADEIAMQLTNMINMDSKPTLVMQYLESWFEFPSVDFVQIITAQIMDLYNNTRQWALKGHTPRELFKEEEKHLKPLPSAPFEMIRSDSKVVELSTRTKVGRNDPCPCGSGKKYKKCCGK